MRVQAAVLLYALVAALLVVPMPISNSASPFAALTQSRLLRRNSIAAFRTDLAAEASAALRGVHRAVLDTQNGTGPRDSPSRSASSLGCTKSLLWWGLGVYCALFVLLAVNHRAQTYLIYLHWLKPPSFLYPLNKLESYRLASSARVVSEGHLRGWHLMPPGPPFVNGTDEEFDDQMGLPAQRVIIFFHGNSGTRACPGKRVDLIRLLAAHFQAHVVTFDYSGFGDSGGRPSEDQLNRDARSMFEWVRKRVALDSDIIIYGQSLGTFAAVDLAAYLCNKVSRLEAQGNEARLVVLDAPPASLVEAAMTHPIAWPFRIVPHMESFFRFVLHEKLDSTAKVQQIKLPLLILHGEHDVLITVDQGQKLYDSARKGGNVAAELVRFPLCGHNNVNASPNYLRVMHTFLDKHLNAPCKHRI